MDFEAQLASINADSRALATAATGAEDTEVPSCPDWTVGRLCDHLSGAHRMATLAIGRDDASFFSEIPARPAETDAVTWLEGGAEALATALADAGPDAPAWTWGGRPVAGFWARRMANETAVHRWDGEAAVGAPNPIDASLAVDAVDEFFDVAIHSALRDRFRLTGAGEALHLHCTDHEGEWLVRLQPDGLAVERAHAKADVAARGGASDLLLVMMGRLPPDAVEVLGDPALLARWQHAMRF